MSMADVSSQVQDLQLHSFCCRNCFVFEEPQVSCQKPIGAVSYLLEIEACIGLHNDSHPQFISNHISTMQIFQKKIPHPHPVLNSLSPTPC